MIRDGVSAGYVKQTEFLIAKYASQSKLNQRNGNRLIALATRADFNPSEIRTDSIRQIEQRVALANDLNAIQESLLASDGHQELTLYWRNLTVIVGDMVVDVRFNVYQYLSFELLERNGQKAFGPKNSGVSQYGGK